MSECTYKGPRIAVIGSCQVAGIGAAIRRMLPDAEVDLWHLGVSPRETKEKTLERLLAFDIVISQIRDGEGGGVLDISRLRETLSAVVYTPVVVFRGFQPDCIYLAHGGCPIESRLGDQHSGIISAAFCLGIPAERVPRLFNSLVYAVLGYFAAFEVARDHMLQTFDAAGYDLRRHLAGWMHEPGAFMYTTNHPHIRVLTCLAQMAAERAGLVPLGTPAPIGVDDALASSVQWPVYPDIARRLGIPGSLVFMQARDTVKSDQERTLQLSNFIAQSYAQYMKLSREALMAHVPGSIIAKLRKVLEM